MFKLLGKHFNSRKHKGKRVKSVPFPISPKTIFIKTYCLVFVLTKTKQNKTNKKSKKRMKIRHLTG